MIWYQHQCQKIFVEMNHWLIIDLFVREVTITLLASPCSATFVWAGSQMCWRPGHPWQRLTGWCVDIFGGLQENSKTVRNVLKNYKETVKRCKMDESHPKFRNVVPFRLPPSRWSFAAQASDSKSASWVDVPVYLAMRHLEELQKWRIMVMFATHVGDGIWP